MIGPVHQVSVRAAINRTRLFDSGGFFAHLVSKDALHTRATELFARAEREGWHLVTTNAVVYETHALLVNRARDGREAGLRFLEHVERNDVIDGSGRKIIKYSDAMSAAEQRLGEV